MKFEIRRTSLWGDERPCKEAIQEEGIRVDLRTCSEEEFDKNEIDGPGSKWRDQGTNHRKAPWGSGCKIARDFSVTVWVVEFNTLEDLLKFYNKYGDLVISGSCHNNGMTEIEIYDNYRE